MTFGIKTGWIAVRDRSPEEVADALGLAERVPMEWTPGTVRAYDEGVFVAAPVKPWTLAHGSGLHDFDTSKDDFVAWLAGLSGVLGEVQHFANHRVVDYCAWSMARDGLVLRHYSKWEEGSPMFLGAQTRGEIELREEARELDTESKKWSNPDGSWAPDDYDVLDLAAKWSVNPASVHEDTPQTAGIFGVVAGRSRRG